MLGGAVDVPGDLGAEHLERVEPAVVSESIDQMHFDPVAVQLSVGGVEKEQLAATLFVARH